jgi:hypothetical protein
MGAFMEEDRNVYGILPGELLRYKGPIRDVIVDRGQIPYLVLVNHALTGGGGLKESSAD